MNRYKITKNIETNTIGKYLIELELERVQTIINSKLKDEKGRRPYIILFENKKSPEPKVILRGFTLSDDGIGPNCVVDEIEFSDATSGSIEEFKRELEKFTGKLEKICGDEK